jgi:hypothetical protein
MFHFLQKIMILHNLFLLNPNRQISFIFLSVKNNEKLSQQYYSTMLDLFE